MVEVESDRKSARRRKKHENQTTATNSAFIRNRQTSGTVNWMQTKYKTKYIIEYKVYFGLSIF